MVKSPGFVTFQMLITAVICHRIAPPPLVTTSNQPDRLIYIHIWNVLYQTPVCEIVDSEYDDFILRKLDRGTQ